MSAARTLKIGNETIEMPHAALNDVTSLSKLLSNGWRGLSEEKREELGKLLPTFPSEDSAEKSATVEAIFKGDNFNFGSPLSRFCSSAVANHFDGDNHRLLELERTFQLADYYNRQKAYHGELLKSLVVKRERLLCSLAGLTEPLAPPNGLEERVRINRESNVRFKQVMSQVYNECLCSDSASDSDEMIDEDDLTEEMGSTLDPAPAAGLYTSEMTAGSAIRVSSLLRDHRRRKRREPRLPRLQVSEIDVGGVSTRTYAAAKQVSAKRLKNYQSQSKREKMEQLTHSCLTQLQAAFARASPPPREPVRPPQATDFVTPVPTFFHLLTAMMSSFPEAKATTNKLETLVRQWQSLEEARMQEWFTHQQDWAGEASSALKFLAGVSGNYPYSADFVPLVDYREKSQMWLWVGSEEFTPPPVLTSFYRCWLQFKDDDVPAPVYPTGVAVAPLSSEDVVRLHIQERERYLNSTRAYTFQMPGYVGVVGPVRGQARGDTQRTKPRDHSLLTSERPTFMTILTLVRDAVARLPNGEGTRNDVTELLKVSQFINVEATVQQITQAVSGALDRLHVERDPCIKFDTSKKLWVYLHRGRTEEEHMRVFTQQTQMINRLRQLINSRGRAASTKRRRQSEDYLAASPAFSPSASISEPPDTPRKLDDDLS